MLLGSSVAVSPGLVRAEPPPPDVNPPVCYLDTEGESVCEADGGGGNLDRYPALTVLTNYLYNVEAALSAELAADPVEGRLQAGLPTSLAGGTNPTGSLPLELHVLGAAVATGQANMTWHEGDEYMEYTFVLVEGDVTRTLEQTMTVVNGVMEVWGTLTVVDAAMQQTTVITGGWTYSSTSGPVEDPASEEGFLEEVAEMFHAYPPGPLAAGLPSLPSIITGIGNGLSMLINYFRDLFIKYTPPTSCSGPSFTSSCDGSPVPCQDSLGEACLLIDDLTQVSTAFKKCMKGRCGCGGSSFGRVSFTCDDDSSCGPCGSGVVGCSLLGVAAWYCEDSNNACDCIRVAMHEMSHACGANDSNNGSAMDAYRIGDWFADEFESTQGSNCLFVP